MGDELEEDDDDEPLDATRDIEGGTGGAEGEAPARRRRPPST